MTSEASPLEKSTSSEEAYEEILRRLRDGRVGLNDRIVDKALAAQLGMSRMPARDALLRLVNEGYLVGTTRGFKLPALSTKDILEIFDIRQMLEPRAIASAAAKGSGVDIAALESALNDARSAWLRDDMRSLIGANTRFRKVWLGAVPNRRLVALISRFYDQVSAVREATLHDPQTRTIAITIATAIFDGFKRHDTLYVHDQMVKFIEAARTQFLVLTAAARKDPTLSAHGTGGGSG
jgi:DNA-binding GntR family transcriptional regulator